MVVIVVVVVALLAIKITVEAEGGARFELREFPRRKLENAEVWMKECRY